MGIKELILDGAPHDIIGELSLAANKSLLIQNKTGGRIVVYPNDTAPPAGKESILGFFVKSGDSITIPANAATKCYVTGGNGSIAVLNY